jgi:hypothetical protein
MKCQNPRGYQNAGGRHGIPPGCVSIRLGFRGCRCAQPPATICDPSGMKSPKPAGLSERARTPWHPSGMRCDSSGVPGVSLCSTPGYGLRSLRDEMPNPAGLSERGRTPWHPSGMRFDSSGVPGVSLCSTPGYDLRSLRDGTPSPAVRVEAFHGAGHCLLSLRDGIPNPEGCQNVAGGRRIAQTSGYRTDMICNPEGCQNVAGGRSIAQTSGNRITHDPHPGGVLERRLFIYGLHIS